MSKTVRLTGIICMLGLGVAQGVAAQSKDNAVQAPTTPAPSPQLDYVSPIGAYKTYEAQSIQSWKESNNTVGRIGGWRAYARETPTAQTPPTATPAPGGAMSHGAHHGVKP